jgi:hypothetical protein
MLQSGGFLFYTCSTCTHLNHFLSSLSWMFLLVFWGKVLLYSTVWTQTCFTAWAGLKFLILLLQPPRCWGYTWHHHAWLTSINSVEVKYDHDVALACISFITSKSNRLFFSPYDLFLVFPPCWGLVSRQVLAPPLNSVPNLFIHL